MASRILSAPPAPSVRRGPRRVIRGRSFRRGRRRGPPVTWGCPEAGRLGRAWAAGALSGERAVFLEPHPRRKAGGARRRRGPGRERGAGRPGFRGLARRESGVEGDV